MSIFASIVLLGVILLVLVPTLTKIPDIKVPNVANLTVIEAEEKLKKAGFEVSVETVKEVSEEVEKGDVIKTSPAAGRSIKKGTTITIYESVGENVYEMENFVGENYIEIQAILDSLPAEERTLKNIMPRLKVISGMDMKAAKDTIDVLLKKSFRPEFLNRIDEIMNYILEST